MEEQTQNEDDNPGSSNSNNQRNAENSDNTEERKAEHDTEVRPGTTQLSERTRISDDSFPSLLGELKSILVNRLKDDTKGDASQLLEVKYSSDSELYRFYRTHGMDEISTRVTKAEVFIYMTIPPDGGYAWLILVTAFLCQVIVDGILLSIGVLLPYIAEELSLSFKQTALIASSQMAPVGSAFINKFGFRPVAVSGAILSSLSILAASFCCRTLTLVLFYGVFAGPAMGMLWVSSSLITNYYFERYRALVGGVSSAGSGVGVILISVLDANLAQGYGWRYTARVHVLLLVVAGLLAISFREVQPTKIGHFVELLADDDTDDSGNSVVIGSDHYSVYTMPTTEPARTSISTPSAAKNLENRISYQSDFETENLAFLQRICPCCVRKTPPSTTGLRRYVISHDILDRDDIFYDGRPDYSRAGSMNQNDTNEIQLISGKEDKAQTISYTLSVIRPTSQAFSVQKRGFIHPKIKSALETLFDFRLLKLAEFRFLLLVAFLFPMGFNIPFIYSAPRAKIRKKYADLLPVVIGLTNIIYRITTGILAYKIKVHVAYLAGIGMVIGGAVTFTSGFGGEDSIFFQFLCAICFGIGTASFGALRATIYVRVLGLEKLTNAFGLATMISGFGAFGGTNTAGILNDYSHGYSMSFIFAGTCMLLAGCLNLCLPKYVQYRKKVDARKAQKKVRFTGVRSKKKWCRKSCLKFFKRN